eukprot:8127007-Pyramimonas_sp.AAC.1
MRIDVGNQHEGYRGPLSLAVAPSGTASYTRGGRGSQPKKEMRMEAERMEDEEDEDEEDDDDDDDDEEEEEEEEVVEQLEDEKDQDGRLTIEEDDEEEKEEEEEEEGMRRRNMMNEEHERGGHLRLKSARVHFGVGFGVGFGGVGRVGHLWGQRLRRARAGIAPHLLCYSSFSSSFSFCFSLSSSSSSPDPLPGFSSSSSSFSSSSSAFFLFESQSPSSWRSCVEFDTSSSTRKRCRVGGSSTRDAFSFFCSSHLHISLGFSSSFPPCSLLKKTNRWNTIVQSYKHEN